MSSNSRVAATRVQRVAVERAPDELLEMADGIERRPDRPDERGPLIAGSSWPCSL